MTGDVMIPKKGAKRDATASKRRILNAALIEFSRYGHAGARVDAIAEAADVSKPMIYSYFGGKEELYKAALRESYLQIREGERKLKIANLEPEDGIRELVRFTMTHFVSQPWFISMLNTENLLGGDAVRQIDDVGEIQSPLIEALSRLLKAGVKTGRFRDGIDPVEILYHHSVTVLFPGFKSPHFTCRLQGPHRRRMVGKPNQGHFRHGFAVSQTLTAGRRMKLSMCNELLAADGLTLAKQCEAAHALGYMGLELALGSLCEHPHELSDVAATDMRRTIEDHGLEVTGLHWLLAPYPETSITDPARNEMAGPILDRLIEICVLMGGRVLVHGSPAQRQSVQGEDIQQTTARLVDFFAPIAKASEAAGVTYCIEPLAPAETSVINTVSEGASLVDQIGSPAFLTMLDTSAAGQSENEPVAEVLNRWLPTGKLGHVQVNDTNRGAPGMGDDPFVDIAAALRANDWPHPVAVEPFRTCINGVVTAAIGAATMRTAWASTNR